MNPASQGGRLGLPRARAALLAALLAPAVGCGGGAADSARGHAAAGAGKGAAAAAGNATDPALNGGGTTPHDTPPLRDRLLEQADAVMRKADPGFDRFEVNYAVGDLDRDGRKDVVIEYGIGDEGAMRHVAKSVYVLLARDDGLQLQPDQTEAFSDCPVIREIVKGQLLADGLEACMLPFPRTLGYYVFEWTGQGLRRVSKQTPEQRVMAQLHDLREALRAGRDSEVDPHLRPGPLPIAALDPGEKPAAPERIFADPQRRREFIDTVGMLGHIERETVNEHQRSASMTVARAGEGPGQRALNIDLAPEPSVAQADGYTYVTDATVTLQWPESDGVGYHVTFRLIDGALYLSDHDAHDLAE